MSTSSQTQAALASAAWRIRRYALRMGEVIAGTVRPDFIQAHGSESPERVAEIEAESNDILEAVRKQNHDLLPFPHTEANARYVALQQRLADQCGKRKCHTCAHSLGPFFQYFFRCFQHGSLGLGQQRIAGDPDRDPRCGGGLSAGHAFLHAVGRLHANQIG